ncbi:hypothetical protein HY251_15885 [bacterium]|nr:hypothetical protein [bacterium]
MDELVASAQRVLQASGLKTDFLRGQDVAMYRYEALDRHIEVVVRPSNWTLTCVHGATRKRTRLRGITAAELEKALRPFCEETPFEPPIGEPAFGRR